MENERAGEGRGGGNDGRKTPDQPQRGLALGRKTGDWGRVSRAGGGKAGLGGDLEIR